MDMTELVRAMQDVCPSDDCEVGITYYQGQYIFKWVYDVDGRWAYFRHMICEQCLCEPKFVEMQFMAAKDAMQEFVNDAVFGADRAP